MMSLIVIRFFFFKFCLFPFILFWNSMCREVCVCHCVAVKSHACYIGIVNDITDSNTCLFSVAGFFLFFFFRKVCVRKCVCLSLCVALNSPACYIWIVNDITDSNTCSMFCLLLCFGIVRWCVCLREYVCALIWLVCKEIF